MSIQVDPASHYDYSQNFHSTLINYQKSPFCSLMASPIRFVGGALETMAGIVEISVAGILYATKNGREYQRHLHSGEFHFELGTQGVIESGLHIMTFGAASLVIDSELKLNKLLDEYGVKPNSLN